MNCPTSTLDCAAFRVTLCTDMSVTSHKTQKFGSSGKAFSVKAVGHAMPRSDRQSMARRGEILRVGRGVYQSTARKQPVGQHPYKAIAALLADEPYFISWWSALSYHGLTEHLPGVVHVAVQKQRRPQFLAGYEVSFVRLKPTKFFGTTTINLDGVEVQIATRERAVIDAIDRPDLSGGLAEGVKAMLSRQIDYDKLVRLAQRFPSHALVRRLGYLMTLFRVGDPAPLTKLRGTSAYTPLDPGVERRAELDRTWHVVDNVGRSALGRWASRDT